MSAQLQPKLMLELRCVCSMPVMHDNDNDNGTGQQQPLVRSVRAAVRGCDCDIPRLGPGGQVIGIGIGDCWVGARQI